MPPPVSRVVRISDGEEILLDGIIKCGWMQIALDGCRDIKTFRATVAGRTAVGIRTFCVDPLSRYYLVNLTIPEGIIGRQIVCVCVDGQELLSWEVQIAPTRR